jgi:small subunit ribosomal protein S20
MPNSKQSIKRQRQNEDRRLRNKGVRTTMRTHMKKVLRAENKTQGLELLPVATQSIDKAAKTNVIHANAAARYKSRLAKRVNALS